MNCMMSRRQLLQLASAALFGSMVSLNFSRLALAAPALPLGNGVEAALGFSLIYEEYKGNYAEAQRLADQSLAEARRAATSTRLAEALWTRGIVHVLQGEPATGLALFKEMEALAPDDSTNVLKARTGALAAYTLQFNTFPDGTTAKGVEVSRYQRLLLVEYAARHGKAGSQVPEGTPVHLASRFISYLFWNAMQARGLCSSAKQFPSEPGAKCSHFIINYRVVHASLVSYEGFVWEPTCYTQTGEYHVRSLAALSA